MDINNPNTLAINYFSSPENKQQNRYCALRAFFIDKMNAEEIAQKYGYTTSYIYSLIRDFKAELIKNPDKDPFFTVTALGRPPLGDEYTERITVLCKNNMSVPEIKAAMDGFGVPVSTHYISSVLKKEGFARLPRRDKTAKTDIEPTEELKKMLAEKTKMLSFETEETFFSESLGIFAFLPILTEYRIDKAIQESLYPETKSINRLCSILCFLALKLTSVKRYSADDLWCMDRGLGMFAGVNILPKAMVQFVFEFCYP